VHAACSFGATQKPRLIGGVFCAIWVSVWGDLNILGMPGDDLLSHSSSTIGAGTFHGRVRDGIEWGRSAKITRQTKDVLDRESLAHGVRRLRGSE
jgi:hypothetical protein